MITHNMPSYYRKIKEVLIIHPDLALLSSPIGSNYPCLELILMVPKVFELLKVYCIRKGVTAQTQVRRCVINFVKLTNFKTHI